MKIELRPCTRICLKRTEMAVETSFDTSETYYTCFSKLRSTATYDAPTNANYSQYFDAYEDDCDRMKIGKLLFKSREWKFYYRFRKPHRILEFETEDGFQNFISDKNVLALALSDLNIHLIAVIKDGRHIVYAIRELSS